MNQEFPRILTLLRKERGISQKQAAAELGISQALLSHYEKGIRECGLDFVVRTADFYQVSCDYLLGRSPERTGATISMPEPPPVTESETSSLQNPQTALQKSLLFHSLNLIFELLERSECDTLIQSVSDYLMLSVYASFRILYDIQPKNEAKLFHIPQEVCDALTSSCQIRKLAALRTLLTQLDKKEYKVDRERFALSSETLQREFPLFSSALLNLIQSSENLIDS